MAKFDMSSELERLGTFFSWINQVALNRPVKPSALDLARAGFSYTGTRDEVRCFSCGLRVDGWEKHHDPQVVHATRSPHCPMVMGAESANQPVFVPPEKEYIKIKAMLTELGKRATNTANGASTLNYPTGSESSLVADTLKMMYGDSMLSSSRQSPQPPGGTSHRIHGRSSSSTSPPSSHRTESNSAASSRSSSQSGPRKSNRSGTSATRRGATTASSPVPSSTSSSPRRSISTSDVGSNSPSRSPQQGRPGFHRAHSYAQPGAQSSRGEDTVANRQTSLPSNTADQRLFRQSEEARLQTFESWAGVRGTSAAEFAQAGFVYIGPPDRVQCVVCQGILKNWNDNDSPIEEHRKHFPDCRFVKEYFSRPSAARSGPRHPNFKSETVRRNSFTKWDMTRNPTPAELAHAGFFYAGHGDNVKCFHCDGGLRNWEPNDDPWREHARWFPKCGFVKACKGSAFIGEVLSSCSEYQSASVDETEPKNVAQAVATQRSVDPREVTARMDSAIVRTVLKMDVPRKLVKKAIKKRLSENGEDFTSAEALLEAVFSLDFSTASVEGEDDEAGELQDSAMISESGAVGSSNSGASSSADSMRLMEENRQLKEQRQCKICMDEEVCVAFLPCGHLVCCATCAPALNACPICRAKIRGTVRTYMS
ncbi:baculoviral iap repeat-containing protein 7-like [Plakobranchus ocellatus]|uniref:Baculoviral iap repeat-containing protein 7-like n=1 Tax=Plakobranchus ocellatus TaxID=259542 RepID=A0AAV3ZWP0_9GAST|nr:baculoviral iap repeat-containing protein 7-like [Plakobranchus ocellatus]